MLKNKPINIVLTGGHAATPGLSLSIALKRRFPEAHFYWIGSKHEAAGTGNTTLEYQILPEVGVIFYSIVMGKLQTKFTRYTIPLIFGIPISFIQVFFILLKLKASVILSFGGFSSFPVVFWGWFFGVPVILHEQTVTAGRAAMTSARFASVIALGREESHHYFPKEKTVVTGNPILSSIESVKPKSKIGRPPTIFIVGGSRGSEFINDLVILEAESLLRSFRIIQITGQANFDKVKVFRSGLPKALQNNYKVFSRIDPREIYKYYDLCDIIIGRAGANTVSEILSVKRPALLIPLPRTFMKEQEKNALYAFRFGIAEVLSENEVSETGLEPVIKKMMAKWTDIVRGTLDKKSPDVGATEKIVEIVAKYIK